MCDRCLGIVLGVAFLPLARFIPVHDRSVFSLLVFVIDGLTQYAFGYEKVTRLFAFVTGILLVPSLIRLAIGVIGFLLAEYT